MGPAPNEQDSVTISVAHVLNKWSPASGTIWRAAKSLGGARPDPGDRLLEVADLPWLQPLSLFLCNVPPEPWRGCSSSSAGLEVTETEGQKKSFLPSIVSVRYFGYSN